MGTSTGNNNILGRRRGVNVHNRVLPVRVKMRVLMICDRKQNVFKALERNGDEHGKHLLFDPHAASIGRIDGQQRALNCVRREVQCHRLRRPY